jgi:hypothetical protein
MLPRLIASAAIASILFATSGQAAAPLKSGPQVGDKNNRSGFYPNWVAGFCANEHMCPV